MIIILFTVDGCQNCPLKRKAEWFYCSHPDAPDGYGNVLNVLENKETPDWCPGKTMKIEA